MIIDTSALVAILTQEDDARAYADAMGRAAGELRISAGTLVEASIVMERRGDLEAGRDLDRLLREMRAEIMPVTPRQAEIARDGWRRFGKGRHRAALNLGDCFAYALAIERGEALLFKGGDFALTDVKKALPADA